MTEISTAQKSNMREVTNMENSSAPQPNADTQEKNQELLWMKTGYNQHTSPYDCSPALT